MKKKIIILLLMLPLLISTEVGNFSAKAGNANAKVDEQELFNRIDQTIANLDRYKAAKERYIKLLKRNLSNATSDHQRLVWLDSIYHAYSTYRYDSASAYVEKGMKLAEKTGDEYYIVQNKLNRANVFSIGGFYSQAESLLQSIDPAPLKSMQLANYYYTYGWLYNYWGSFVAGSEFAHEYAEKKKHYLQLAVKQLEAEHNRLKKEGKKLPATGLASMGFYYFLKGELIYLDYPTQSEVSVLFRKSMDASPAASRTHASAAYGLARYYQDIERNDLYEQYITESAISDMECQLKETVALQKYATYLYTKDSKYSKRAAKYINISMEDAQFYNNRLRMMEISNILPVIASANQQAAERSKTRLLFYFWCLCAVLAITVGVTISNIKSKNKLKRNRKTIEHKNLQLEMLNERLVATNKRRETYLRLFMDISALYIRKLDNYRKLVSRKIKANQTADLLKSLSSYKLAEEDSREFYIRFDKAFMELYPDFVNQLNELLLPENQLKMPSAYSLTTEVRIYALMRLGVTDSQEIATLLFYSTQTIYNYKSAMRAKAKNRETFEADINHLCHLI